MIARITAAVLGAAASAWYVTNYVAGHGGRGSLWAGIFLGLLSLIVAALPAPTRKGG